MRALARHIVICLVCTDVQGHATRCMRTERERDDVWCTSMRRLVRREKRLHTEWQKGGNSARLTLSRLDTVAVQPGQQERQRFWDPPTQPGTVSRKGGITIHGKEVFSARFWLVSGSLDVLGFSHSVRQSPSQTGGFYTAPIMVGVRASLTPCVLLLRAISARARVAFGRWVLDDPFPQFRSHGRIHVTGPGIRNFRA